MLAASPSAVNFGAFDTTFDVDLRNAGGGNLTIVSVTPNQPWLQAAPLNVDADGLGTYRLSVDRSQVSADGTYTGVVTVTSTANSIDISVVMQKIQRQSKRKRGTALRAADRQRHQPRREIRRPSARTTVNTTTASPASAPANIWIYAGTDSDNDNLICDAGEACGAFRTLDAPEVLTINGDRTDLDFISGFPVNLFNLSVADAVPTRADPTVSHCNPLRRQPTDRNAPIDSRLPRRAALLTDGLRRRRSHRRHPGVDATATARPNESGVRLIDYATLATFRGDASDRHDRVRPRPPRTRYISSRSCRANIQRRVTAVALQAAPELIGGAMTLKVKVERPARTQCSRR